MKSAFSRRLGLLGSLCLAAGLSLTGCSVVAAGAGGASPPLQGTTWALVPLSGPVPAPADPAASQQRAPRETTGAVTVAHSSAVR